MFLVMTLYSPRLTSRLVLLQLGAQAGPQLGRVLAGPPLLAHAVHYLPRGPPPFCILQTRQQV